MIFTTLDRFAGARDDEVGGRRNNACNTKEALEAPFFLRLFELDEGLVDPSPAVVSPPHTAPDYRAIDRTPRNDQGPNVPEPRPGGTEADIKLIVKIVQHEATQRLDEARPPHLATASHRVSELSAWGTRLN
jgi:hypothetical protein